MTDELSEIIKKYVKEAIHEYFRDMWREFEKEELPYPPPLIWLHPRHFQSYRKLYDSFERDVESLSHSVKFLSSFSLQLQDWRTECSEKEKIDNLTKEVGEIREAMIEIRDLLEQITSK